MKPEVDELAATTLRVMKVLMPAPFASDAIRDEVLKATMQAGIPDLFQAALDRLVGLTFLKRVLLREDYGGAKAGTYYTLTEAGKIANFWRSTNHNGSEFHEHRA